METIDELEKIKNDFKIITPDAIEAMLKDMTVEEKEALLRLYIYERNKFLNFKEWNIWYMQNVYGEAKLLKTKMTSKKWKKSVIIRYIVKAKNPYASLDCVPLNCIFQCLKYGNYIAIIENEEFDYTKDYDGNAIAISAKISSKKQKVVKILDPRKKEVIDYILNEVGDVKKIYPGHASEDNLGKETYKYLEAKLELPKRYNYI